jgi:hypothetical protein
MDLNTRILFKPVPWCWWGTPYQARHWKAGHLQSRAEGSNGLFEVWPDQLYYFRTKVSPIRDHVNSLKWGYRLDLLWVSTGTNEGSDATKRGRAWIAKKKGSIKLRLESADVHL